MTSFIRLEVMTVAPVAVETELAALVSNATQANLAEVAGLTNNSRISRALSLVSGGSCDGHLEAFSAAKVLKWARAHAPLANAIKRYMDGEEAQDANLVDALRVEISAAAESIVHINAALADNKLTRPERKKLAVEMRKAVDRQTRAIRALERP